MEKILNFSANITLLVVLVVITTPFAVYSFFKRKNFIQEKIEYCKW